MRAIEPLGEILCGKEPFEGGEKKKNSLDNHMF